MEASSGERMTGAEGTVYTIVVETLPTL